MDTAESNGKRNAAVELNEISKLIQNIEKKVMQNKVKVKECEEFTLLKEKCCDSDIVVSFSAFHGIRYLVEKNILVQSQTIPMLVSLLPSIKEFGGLVSTIGNILLSDFKLQITKNGKYECFHIMQGQHPFLIVLKCNWEKSWFEIYSFILELMRLKEDMTWEYKIEFIRPVFHQLFWSSSCQGSQLQLKLFNALMMEFNEKKVMRFALETFLWQEVDIHFCLYLQEFFIHLLNQRHEEAEIAAFGLTPLLAVVTKWTIKNGYNPYLWLKILWTCVERNMANGSTVLFILADILIETPSMYISQLVDVCKSIIFSTCCNKYVAYKFVAVILNWFVSPSFLANPINNTLEKILDFMKDIKKWNDQTSKLNDNEYYKKYGNSKMEAKFAVDLMCACNLWEEGITSVEKWLENVKDSNEHQMQFKVHSFIQGILLCEKNPTVIKIGLEILFELIEKRKELSFSVLCLLFYKLGKEEDPIMQNIYLFSLPKLSVKKSEVEQGLWLEWQSFQMINQSRVSSTLFVPGGRGTAVWKTLSYCIEKKKHLVFSHQGENIPLIVGIIESLKRGFPKLMTPIAIQLYLSLWKFDNRTYSYLHKMLHENPSGDFDWELNVSKAIALKEICQLAPHLHAKDLVGVLSRILNENSGNVSGLPSAIAIEAVTELCKAYVIDAMGTWTAIQPKLRIDKRPEVVVSLCRFFGEIPNLNSSEQHKEELTKDIVPMLWNYTFFNNKEVVKSAFRALSNFPIESLPLKLFPEIYKGNIKLSKYSDKEFRNPEDMLQLPYVPAESWVLFLEKIDVEVLQEGGELVKALVERELTSLPRGVFYLPPEKSEPLSYSYLPPKSICRGLVEHLQKHSRENLTVASEHLQEIIRVLAHQYSKFLPPLHWGFLENFMSKGWEFLRYCLALVVKQASVSPSAWSILESYFRSVEWNLQQVEDILFFYNLMPILCRSVSYGILQNFLERTLKLCLEATLNGKGTHFEKIIENLTDVLKNKAIQPCHKNLIAKQLENILNLIPPEHEIMKKYAKCATEFPVKLVEEMTSAKESGSIDSEWLRRAIKIRSAISMREDINNPLVWLSEFTETVALHPEEQNFFLMAIWFIIRRRRDCDHRPWILELIWKTQTFMKANESNAAALFFVDLFISITIILSGYDCLFVDVHEFLGDESKKLKIFPQVLCDLLSAPNWSDMLPKVGLWLQKLSNWKHLPQDRVIVFVQTLLALREVKSFGKENEFSLFNFPLPVV